MPTILRTDGCKVAASPSRTGEPRSLHGRNRNITQLVMVVDVRKALSRAAEQNSRKKSPVPMSDTVRRWLAAREPKDFLTAWNPSVGARVVASGQSCGEIARRNDVPTLAAVADVYDEATAIAWLCIEIDSIDITQGAAAYSETARKDAAHLIFAKYADMNVAEFLLFFTRYKLGEFYERVQHTGGVQRLMLALRLYRIQRDDDVRRLEREEVNLKEARERAEWDKKAISYEEYLRQKAIDDAAAGSKNGDRQAGDRPS